ncbi:GNAT family N-acetyltransferase [Marinobacter sp. F4206]|uniref:GNAT family N-acetyltransferase n=1 Tax=Marinobacter sp. F4206 TaxID=2861777 RepID=UPI001C5CE9E3|nr:GNAT family N-acetyltransferase [Marinobacter sp. F4206]MBW4934964.1 GNAT family N-acetyltransferase [Marinobacter sp. F4206]
MKIHPYLPHWAPEIADLFHWAVHAISPSVYGPKQKEAWAPTPPDYTYWSERLVETKPMVAIMDDRIAGFMELGEHGHIDCAYTHPDFQRRGVASALYAYVLAEAKARHLDRLYVEASLVARPFFEHRGFSVITQNEVERNGVTLVNFRMEKPLPPAD